MRAFLFSSEVPSLVIMPLLASIRNPTIQPARLWMPPYTTGSCIEIILGARLSFTVFFLCFAWPAGGERRSLAGAEETLFVEGCCSSLSGQCAA